MHVRAHGADSEFDSRDLKTLVDVHDKGTMESAAADDYFFYEEKALKLNLTICNQETEALADVEMSLAFPRLKGFELVDHLYAPPGNDNASAGSDQSDYPAVQKLKKGAVAVVQLGNLAPNISRQVLACPLRLAVGPAMAGKKVAIKYTLQAKNKQNISQGRLKIEFGEVTAKKE